MDKFKMPSIEKDLKLKRKPTPPTKYRCFVCKIRYNKVGSFVGFKAPMNTERRERWSRSCGVSLPPNARICDNHFTDMDFIMEPCGNKKARLQPGALPKPLKGILKTEFPYADDEIGKELDTIGDNLEEPLIELAPKQDANISFNPQTSCLICFKTKNDKVSLYGLPKNKKLHNLWCEKLGKDLLNGTQICANHFLPSDFAIKNKQPYLKEEAIPSQHLKGYNKSNRPTNVLYINKPSQIEYVELASSSFAEPPDIEENLRVIKEEENITSFDVCAKPKMSNKSIQTNVGYIRTCGYIEVSTDNNIFSMNCFYCEDTFPIWSWGDFVTHIRETHQQEEQKLRMEFSDIQEMEKSLKASSTGKKLRKSQNENEQNNLEGEEGEIDYKNINTTKNEIISDDSKNLTMNNKKEFDYFQDDNLDITEQSKCFSNFDSSSPSSDTDNYTDNEDDYDEDEEKAYKNNLKKARRKKTYAKDEFGAKNQTSEQAETSSTVACYHCETLFSNHVELKDHQHVCLKKRQNESRELSDRYCTLCNKVFNSPCYYRKHMQNHKPPSLKCPICNKEFRWQQSLNDHIKLHSNQRDHVCELCGRAFLRPQKLFEHKQLKHSDECNYKCAICGHAYKTSSLLSSHRKMYHFVLEGTIEELTKFINYRERNASIMNNTSKYELIEDPVTNKRLWKCDLCDKTYGRTSHVSRHRAKMHGVNQKGAEIDISKD